MLDKLFILTTLCALQGPITDIREPMRANTIQDFTIYNATNYEIMVFNLYDDAEYIVPAKTNSIVDLQYNHPDDLLVYIHEDWDTIPTLWYECLDSIGQPTYPNWEYNNDEWVSKFRVQGLISNSNGLGIYEEKYIPNTQTYYIAPYTWGGISKGLSDWTGTNTILPTNGMNPRIHKKDGSYMTASNIQVRRTNIETNVNYATLVYATINGTYFNLANNFGFKEQTFTGFPSPQADTDLQPYLLYYNDWTNEVTFWNTQMPKNAESDPNTGYVPFKNLVTDNPGYLGYSEQSTEETMYALTAGFTFAYMAFTAIAPLWGYMVFPGVSIGLLICIPLLISLVFAVIKLIKKGG